MSVADPQRTRSVGTTVFLLADGLFCFALLFIVLSIRAGLREWPDVPASAVVPATVPCLAVGALVFGALLHRAGPSLWLPAAAAGTAFVLVLLALRGAALQGLTINVGRYGAVVYGLTGAWAAQIAVAFVLLVLQLGRSRGTADTPGLGRFLAFLAVVGAVYVGAVFLW